MQTYLSDYLENNIPISDVCIVGTGAAGLEIARHLGDKGISIALIEGGFDRFDQETQNLSRIISYGMPLRTAPHGDDYIFKMQSRLRQFGGTINIWGGKWKALDPFDFEGQTSIGKPPWPIAYSEVAEYYRKVARDYGAGELLELMEDPFRVPLSMPASTQDLVPKITFLETPPLNLASKFGRYIKHSENIRLILGANAIKLSLSENQKRVNELTVSTLSGKRATVRSKVFILACGAIENARLLLLSNEEVPSGIGNLGGLVGKNFLEHPKGVAGTFIPFSKDKKIEEGFLQSHCHKMFRTGIALSPKHLREKKLPNHTLYLLALAEDQKPGNALPDHYLPYFHLEQLPHPESRVFLTEKKDLLNTPIAGVDWKFREEDFDCFRRYLETLKSLLASNRMGTLNIDESCFDMNFIRNAEHHMGTTKMGKNPKEGVVDSDCKVFGLDNLYIGGSSVFPTVGSANPTFTILALARRLSDKIGRVIWDL